MFDHNLFDICQDLSQVTERAYLSGVPPNMPPHTQGASCIAMVSNMPSLLLCYIETVLVCEPCERGRATALAISPSHDTDTDDLFSLIFIKYMNPVK